MHYNRWLRNGDPTIRTKRIRITQLPCTVLDCNEPIAGRGLCKKHHQRKLRHGDPNGHARPYWTEAEDRHLYAILDRTSDGLSHALCGEVLHLSLVMRDRSPVAIRSRLSRLRADRKTLQNRAIQSKC